MAILTVPDKDVTLHDQGEIRQFLNARGVLFEQWPTPAEFAPDADQDTILAAYAPFLEPYMAKNGYQVADVISVNAHTPNLDMLKNKFLTEHRHTEDEVRFFVDGQGLFWFNQGGKEDVFCVTCQKGDLISVPANTAHWFDFGQNPFVKAIRVFIDTSGWVPHYTASGVDAKYNALTAAS